MLLPVTVAVNCWVPPVRIETALGDNDTATGALTVSAADAHLLLFAMLVAVTT